MKDCPVGYQLRIRVIIVSSVQDRPKPSSGTISRPVPWRTCHPWQPASASQSSAAWQPPTLPALCRVPLPHRSLLALIRVLRFGLMDSQTLWERRCSRDKCPELHIIKYTSIRQKTQTDRSSSQNSAEWQPRVTLAARCRVPPPR